MADAQTSEAFTWEVAGKLVVNPDVFFENAAEMGYECETDDPLIMIDCPRGAHPGRARLLFCKEDADALSKLTGPQTILVKRWTQTTQNDLQQWNVSEQFEFKGYHVLETRDALDIPSHSTLLNLVDERYLLANTPIRKRYNVVFHKGQSGDLYDREKDTFYPDSLDDGDPWEYEDILNDLLSELDVLPSLNLPVDYDPPRNLVFDCSLAEAIDQLLASIGCALVYDPLASDDKYRVCELDTNFNESILNAAKESGRVIEQPTILFSDANKIPSKVNVRPISEFHFQEAAMLALADVITLTIEARTGIHAITIDDHEFEPDRQRIRGVVKAWYGPLEKPRNELYQGLIPQTHDSEITHLRWYFENGNTQTRVQNLLTREIPWPKQPLLCKSPVYFGKLTSGLFPGQEGDFTVWNIIDNEENGLVMKARLPSFVSESVPADTFLGVRLCPRSGKYVIDLRYC